MTFVIITKDNQTAYYEYDKDTNRAYNIRGGHIYLNKNLENYEFIEVDSWNTLHKITGYNPLVSDDFWHCCWISPDGNRYNCESHEGEAEYIYELLYGNTEEKDSDCFGDELITLGWIKVDNSAMFNIYLDNGYYNNDKFHSKEQREVFDNWCLRYRPDAIYTN